jgi:DNA-directed RNA polymerase subunit alpha
MPIRYGRFEMPKTLGKEESTATDTYAKFIAEPFEAGYGHTVGNSLRRVLLSSLEGAAITAVKIAGAQHEFATLPGVVEDLTDIVLNLKKVKFKLDGQDHEPKKLSLVVNKEGEVTAGDIQTIQGFEVLNPKQLICTLDRKHKFDAELEVRVGRGFATGEENKRPDQPITEGELQKLIDIIVAGARSGQVGDGKIFVSELSQVVRIRTGETGDAAL